MENTHFYPTSLQLISPTRLLIMETKADYAMEDDLLYLHLFDVDIDKLTYTHLHSFKELPFRNPRVCFDLMDRTKFVLVDEDYDREVQIQTVRG